MNKIKLFIGGYTQENSSNGLYSVNFDLETGKFSSLDLFVELNNPSFLAFSKSKNMLYTLEELCNNDGGGKLHSICILNPDSKKTSVISFGEHPCYLGINSTSIFCANYSTGSLSSYSLLKCGQINNEKSSTITLSGKGPNAERQESSHAHFFDFINNSLFSVDLGSDTICEFEAPSQNNSDPTKYLKKNEFKTPPGHGPRHLCSNPFSKDEIWVSCELNSKVLCYQKKSNKWNLTHELETLYSRDIETFQKNNITNFPSHLAFNPKSETLYVSNRGHDSLSVFQIVNTKWTLVQNFPSNGSFPRHFSISPCGNFLISANQLGNNLSSFKLDSNGKISERSDSINHPNPTCVIFSNLI